MENINVTLQYWRDQFQSASAAADGIGAGINVMEKTKPVLKVYGFDDIDSIENITSVMQKRQILDKLQVNLVAFKDRFEIRCQIPIEAERSVNVILNLEIPPLHKPCRRNSPSKS